MFGYVFADFLVLGAGIAGASAGYFLAESGKVILLEMEGTPGYHSTGRSAALFSEYYGGPVVRALTIASRPFLEAPPPGFAQPLLRPRPVLALCAIGSEARFEAVLAQGSTAPTPAREVEPTEVHRYCPIVRPDWYSRAMIKPAAMDIDVDALHQGFLRGIRANAGTVVTSARVRELSRRGNLFLAVTDVGVFRAPFVLNAAGAWADEVAGLAGVQQVGLIPKRRTAILVDGPQGVSADGWPMVTDVAESFYFKPESGGLLMSPADETPVPPGDARPDDLDIAIAAARVQACTTLVIRRIRAAWAGLRSCLPDDIPVIGEAPCTPGFFWLAALGGYGIQTAPTAGRLAAALVTSDRASDSYLALGIDPADLAPSRCQSVGGPSAREALMRGYSQAGQAEDYGAFRPVARLIEEQADRNPGRTAACYGDRALTYTELDRLANGLAAAAHGVGKGDLVAVLLVNSLELPVAYLAMLKLGAVFVPLDPAWPQERLRTTLRVLSPALILCAAIDQVPPEHRGDCAVIAIDDIRPSTLRPRVPLDPDDLIYGFFTSGTTGTPKCAMNRQAGLANRLLFMTRHFAATGTEVVLQNSKHTVDSSLWQLLWPLTTGGRTVLPTQGDFLNLHNTLDTIAEHGVTCTDFVSSVFNVLAAIADTDEEARRKLISLRHVIVGSEEVNARAVHRFRARLPGVQVTNGYGPTETSIGMVFHRVGDADGDLIPLGRPIDNCYVVVVGEDGNVVPRRTVGEIVIGGACIGAGYHADPAATALAFVANRFSDQIPGDRLYLSGDLGYLDDRGQLFFAGRKDDQAKIGGVRVELGEVELAAQKCPGVRQAKALVAQRGDSKSLALFAVADPELTDVILRGYLRRLLPRTSMPRHCVVLTEMPLGEGGKVDSRALHALLDRTIAAGQPDGDGTPAGLPGQVLATFRSVLGLRTLSASASFMDAGGDSISALLAVRDLARQCAVDLSVQDLLDHPTAWQLAAAIDERRAGGAPAEAETSLIERDAAFGAHETIRATDRRGQLRTVLLTGATGFVGSRLAYELLVRTDVRLCCLARADEDDAARRRVISSMAERGLWEPAFDARIDCYASDLGHPDLGLVAGTWQHLAQTCDLVIHNGALVNFLYGYGAHRPANVTGTASLLRLAMASRPVPVHYVSTLAALQTEAARQNHKLGEEFDPVHAQLPGTGYSKSKLVAERYLAGARRRGVLVTVLRLGEVLPSQRRTYPNHQAVTHLLLSAIHRLGGWPDVAIRSDYTPVDYAARRVVTAVLDRNAWGRTLHVFRPESVCFAEMLSLAGADVTRISCAEFLARLHAAAASPGGRDLSRLAALLPAPGHLDEPGLRRALAGLLTDNPALFRKDECHALEQRWQLTDGDLGSPVRAYLAYLDRLAVTAAPAHQLTGGS